MSTVSDLNTIVLSRINYIDALLDKGPNWNYLTPAGNTLYYTFSVASANEANTVGQQAFTTAQQTAARGAFAYISQLTGIKFTETSTGGAAQIHLCNLDIADAQTTGLCSWHSNYTYSGNNLLSYDVDAYVYLDNVQFLAQNVNLQQGGSGYETLLHELGHALGLKHPFDTEYNTVTLPTSQDNTSNTLMSYTSQGGNYATYRQDDIAALNWLYGRDGLGGLGVTSTTGARYITGTGGADALYGTIANDTLEGAGGNDLLDGSVGTDTAVFSGARSDYRFAVMSNGDLQVNSRVGTDGNDILRSIEILKFSNGSFALKDILSTAPASTTPTLALGMDTTTGYAYSDMPEVTGTSFAGANITLYGVNNEVLGTTKADATGQWSFVMNRLPEGVKYQVSATATDAAGNVSFATTPIVFNVDVKAPTAPTAVLNYTTGSNQATVHGTGEPGTKMVLVRVMGDDPYVLASGKVAADGSWSITTSPLPNGTYKIQAVSLDLAENSTGAKTGIDIIVDSKANIAGTANNDTLLVTAGNNAISGQDGLDTAIFAGARADYTLVAEDWGHGITDKVGTGGHDSLIDVERVQFRDATVALDVDGGAGQAYRLYQAAFDRVPDLEGLGYWIARMDHGAEIDQVASEFLAQPEFVRLYGTNPTNFDFLTRLYANVLHRTPDADGFKFWLNALDKEGVPRAHLLAQFSESPENQNNVYDSIKDGITHTPWIVGTDINETLRPVGGDNVINGQGGLDTAVYAGARSTYTLEKIDGGYSITDKVGYGGHDKLFNVERLVFDDATIALDVDGHGGQAYRLVEAGLGRVPTAAELGQWIARLDGGASLDQAASELIASAAFTQKYGTNETDTAFVTGLYTNVWHNAPDSATLDSWVTELHNTSRAHVLVEFSESATNQAQVIGSIQNGIVYTPLHA